MGNARKVDTTVVAGQLLVDLKVITDAERMLAVQKERDKILTCGTLTDFQKRQFLNACEKDPQCKKTAFDLCRETKDLKTTDLPRELPRLPEAITLLITEGKIALFKKGEEELFTKLSDLVNGIQATGRADRYIETFGPNGIAQDKLAAIQKICSSSPKVEINKFPDEKWIGFAQDITKKSQAVTSMLKYFATATNEITQENPDFYRKPEIQQAVKAASALQYLFKQELVKELTKTGKATEAVSVLNKELENVDISKILEKQDSYFAAFCRGTASVLHYIPGLQRLGKTIEKHGYKTDTSNHVAAVVQGTHTAIENIPAAAGSNRPDGYDNLMEGLTKRAGWAGLGEKAIDAVFNRQDAAKKSR